MPNLVPAPWVILSEVEGGWEGQILALAASELGWKKEGVPVNSQAYILSARAVLAPGALNSYLAVACLPQGARKSRVFRESSFLGLTCSSLLCLQGVPDLPVAPQDEAGLTKTFQTWPRGWFHIP